MADGTEGGRTGAGAATAAAGDAGDADAGDAADADADAGDAADADEEDDDEDDEVAAGEDDAEDDDAEEDDDEEDDDEDEVATGVDGEAGLDEDAPRPALVAPAGAGMTRVRPMRRRSSRVMPLTVASCCIVTPWAREIDHNESPD
jgi:hypothetical protein